MKECQKVYTENVYGIGLTEYPGALIINKRFSNIPPGAPIFMYNWAEDNIIRERVFVAADKQGDYELHPQTPAGRSGRRRSDRLEASTTLRPARRRGRSASRSAASRDRVPTPSEGPAMIRFLLVRIASAIPVLFVLSVITFAIIQAPPGDYGDYIRSQLINQGNATFEAPRPRRSATARSTASNDPLIVQYVNWIAGIVTRGDFGWSYFYNKPVGRGGRRAAAAHDRAGAGLPHPRVGHRHRASASSPPPGSIPGSTRLLSASRSSA